MPTANPGAQGTTYQSLATQFAQQFGIDPNIFTRQIQQESGFNPRAVSPAGAQGIAQFMPATAASMGVNPWDVNSSLRGAAILDSANLQHYGGDYQKMLAAYNAGGGSVNSAVSRCGKGWLACMPSETQNYVKVIMGSSTPGKPATSTSPATPTNTPSTSTSATGILAQVKVWGEYIAIFFLALGLMLVGFFLLAGKQAEQVTKTVVKAAAL